MRGKAHLLVLIAAPLLAVVGCSSSDDTKVTSNLLVNDLEPAIEAVKAAHPGEQVEFTEINVQIDLINLFYVQPGGTEIAYVWTDGKLADPGAAQAQLEGAQPFTLAEVNLSAIPKIVEKLATDLPDSLPTQLALTRAESGLNWSACVLGAQGSTIAVGFSVDGQVLGAVPDGCSASN